MGSIWVGGGLNFSLPIKSYSYLYSISETGDAVGVRATDNSPTQIAILVRGGSVSDLASVVGQGTVATHINKGGLVCGWGWNNPKAFVYDANANSVVTWIDPLPGTQRAVAACINASNEVAGRSDNHAFIFSSGATADLGPIAFVADLNDASVICGSIGKPFPQNFAGAICDTKTSSPNFVEIPPPPGFIGSHGEGINNSGHVVGTCWNQSTYNGAQSAFIYQQGVSTDLNTLISNAPGWHLEFAHDINDSGEISGTGTLYGRQTGFLLTPLDWRHGGVSLPELVATLLGGVDRDAGGWRIIGGHRIPIGPWGPWTEIPVAKRDALIALALDEVAMFITDRGAREAARKSLIEVARGRLGGLLQNVGEGRFMRSSVQTVHTRRRMQHGKTVESLMRSNVRE